MAVKRLGLNKLAWMARLPEHNPDVVMRLSRRGSLVYLNRSARALLGERFGCGEPVPSWLLEAVQQAFTAAGVYNLEYQLGERWFWFCLRRDGKAVNVYGRDITARKCQEAELLASQERYRKLVELSPDAIVVHRDQRVIYANGAAARLLGVAGPHALLGLDVVQWAPVSMHDRIRARAVLAQGGQQTPWIEIELERPGGGHVVCEVAGVGIEFEGKPAVQMVLHDVTERRRVEAQLRLSHAAVHAANCAKSRFLQLLSHELRNPLAAMTNSLQLLARVEPGGAAARRAHAVLGRQVEQLTRLVEDLLDITRIERNKIELRRVPLDLTALARQTVEDWRPVFSQAGVKLELDLAPQPVVVEADQHRLVQVLGNLLHNAVKFTPAAGRVVVAVTEELLPRAALLTVTDTGAGWHPSATVQLFDPFMQADNTRQANPSGLGLGLALVKALVELHGGEVHATSAGVGQGSQFVIRLPQRAESGAAP